MLTKHEQILQYIEALEVGEKISVRQIAKILDVSEGTAYRALKEAETRGIVSTIERVGTIRIENQQKKIERLTFAEVVNIVDGTVLGGHNGLHKTLYKFVIAAMQLEAIPKYIDHDSLLIVGNRMQVQRMSLEHGAAVLVTGGFNINDDVKELADQLQLPVISSSYDTFTVASLINQAIYDRMVKKDVLLVEDIIATQTPAFLKEDHLVKDWHSLLEHTGHSRFPVVDEELRVIGMVSPRDMTGAAMDTPVSSVMTPHPHTVSIHTSVAAAANLMVWEGFELLPVVDKQKLVGVISRQDVIKGIQISQKQPHMTETMEDYALKGFEEERTDDRGICLMGEVTPQMTNRLGSLSSGTMMLLIEAAVIRVLRRLKTTDMIVESTSIYFIKPVMAGSFIRVQAHVLDIGRTFGKVEVEILHQEEIVGKALVTAQTSSRL
ncbi:CBS domain-containing protein [Fodinisporobacter ferrooxydans]|uniref:CBS domain-containing protein n=1 Tax=Fodinisporobacter ferrooxydans TaxID=2901836 RepID=A0ABY4CG07_9BACL|nr:CBS domain-containing protein [Alicyclobacillaceae bacterium MYW30-H2]